VPTTPQQPVEQKQPGHTEWIFKNGKWIPIQVGPPQPTVPTVEPEIPQPQVPVTAWDEEADKTRLIKIPAEKLLAGDPRYNIVIRPGDSIFVPVDIVGEFYIMGNVNRTGPIPLTGRPMNLKQAIASAGGLGPLAWPKRCEIVRRIGRKKEEIVMVDLDKIYSGEQPDFFIKPHDLINVGTHATSRWRAVLRNAFRATYGFGFVYDRNFADMDFVGAAPVTRQVLDWF
jgi:polysaccharide export outer membrane protein